MTLRLLLVAAGLAAARPGGAQPAPPPPAGGLVSVVSQSGQFTVFGPRTPGAPASAGPAAVTNVWRDLTPATLAVAAERAKERLLAALGQPDRWREGGGRRGKIFLVINPRLGTNEALRVQAAPFEAGWQYRLEVPERWAEPPLVRGLTQALLLDFANRNATGRCAEIPLWLLEGATQAILTAGPAPVVPQPESRAVLEARRPDPLAGARAVLTNLPPADLDAFALPDPARLTPAEWAAFSASAHLFLHELARLPEGRRRVAQFIQTLPRFYNWQSAFTATWPERFPTLLQAAKWWALTLADFTGRDEWQAWPPANTLARLEEVLHPPVLRRDGTNALPQAAPTPLPQVLAGGNFAQQAPVLRRMIEQLVALRLRAAPEVGPLVDEYVALLREHLAERGRAGFEVAGRGAVRPSLRLLYRAAAERAEALETRRLALAARYGQPLAFDPPGPLPAAPQTAAAGPD
jgi:hypothetical protein